MPGNFSGGSFSGAVGGFSVDSTQVSGGFEIGRLGPRRRDPEEIRRDRVRLGILPERIIEDVALRQAADWRRDEQQKLEELRGELRLQGVEMESVHIQALNDRRERILREEIGARIRKKMQAQMEEEAVVLMFIAVAI